MYKNISDKFKTELFNRSRMNRGYITPIEEFSKKGTNININNSVVGKTSIKLAGKSTQVVSTDPISPSPDYPSEIESISGNVEIKSTGINQWNNDLVNTKNVTKNIDGFTMNNIWGVNVLENKDVLKTFKPNTKYTIKIISKILAKPTTLGTSGTSGYDLVLYRANNSVWLPLNNYEKYTANVGDIFTSYKTITTLADLTDLRVLGYSFYGNNDGSTNYKGAGSVEIQQIMVAEGTYTESNFPNYESYQSSSTIVDLKGNELTKYDELIIEDGRATLQKKSRHLSLAIKDMNNSEEFPGWMHQTQLKEDYPNLNNSFNNANINMISNITKDSTNIGLNTTSSTNVLILFKKLFNGMTQTEIKTNYPDLVFDLIYELSEPYEIDLGKITTLKTFNGTTYITNSEDADMEVEYNGHGEKINNFVQSQFSVISRSSVDGKIIGNVIAKDFQCQIYNAKNYDLANKEIDVFTGLKFQDETEEYVPWGKFIIDTYENVESSNYVTIKALDYMIKFNPSYVDNNSYPCYFKDWVVNFLNYFEVESGQLSYKLTTDAEIDTHKRYYKKIGNDFELIEEPNIEEISTYYEVTFGGLSNENFYVSETPEIANLTGRQILKSIAKMFGSFATIGRDNKLYFKLKEVPTDSSEIPKLSRSVLHSLTKNQEYSPINVVVLKLGQVEGENITKRDETSVLENGEHIIQIEDNVFLNSQEKREAAIDELFDRLNGFTYVDFSSEWKSFMYLDVGDAIQVQNKDDDEYFDSILLNQVVYIPNTTKSTISAPSESKTDEKYQFTEEQKQWNLFTELRVNKVEGEITSTTKKTQNIEDNLNDNYYTKTNINELVQTSETGITNTFSEAGGNNIFRNTGLWFADDKDNTYEYWQGEVIKNTNDSASSNSSMLLLNGSLSQEQEVPNGNYSISFYYQKLIELANASVVINEIEYQLDSTEVKQFYTGEQDSETKEYIVQPIIVTNGHIKIEFKCDTNNGVEVYDLMCNKGSVKLAYSQNQNETTTDTVNISKGITITSSVDENVKFKANYDGIRVLDGNNTVKTKFTDKGMETDEAKITEKAEITGLLFQEVDEQSWITKM